MNKLLKIFSKKCKMFNCSGRHVFRNFCDEFCEENYNETIKFTKLKQKGKKRMKIKYRLTKVNIYGEDTYLGWMKYKKNLLRTEWHIQKRNIFGNWKTIMNNIKDKDYGLELLKDINSKE